MNEPTVLVLGGSGFIGRHAVAALLVRGCKVLIGSRRPGQIEHRLPAEARCCPRLALRFEYLTTREAWSDVIAKADVILNCVGILRSRGRETYDALHHRAPAALAAACRDSGKRLIHVSALGLDKSCRSGFLRSKLDGEQALRASGADWIIVRPSLLDGEGGYGAKWLRRVARWPIHPLPSDSVGRIAVLDVRDLGEALAELSTCPEEEATETREFDLGGMHTPTLAEYLAALRRSHFRRPAMRISIPGFLARLGAHFCNLLRVTPYSFGHWELLRRDNCPKHNRLPELLGRSARAVGLHRGHAVAGQRQTPMANTAR